MNTSKWLVFAKIISNFDAFYCVQLLSKHGAKAKTILSTFPWILTRQLTESKQSKKMKALNEFTHLIHFIIVEELTYSIVFLDRKNFSSQISWFICYLGKYWMKAQVTLVLQPTKYMCIMLFSSITVFQTHKILC